MLAFGLGTHFVPSENLRSLENALEKMAASLDSPNVAATSMIINKFAQEATQPTYKMRLILGLIRPDKIKEWSNLKRRKETEDQVRLNMINQCFCGESCEEILSSLERLATKVQEKWVHDAITSMKSANPLGLKIFLRTIREGRTKNIKQCIETEYIAISHVLGRTCSNNFYEGSRAMLIDKDKKPQWEPSKLEEVTEEMVAKCLSISFSEDDDWLPLQLPTKANRSNVGPSKL
ncbi:hypothetical protein M8C21_015418 [Ambrosia artemisiifolia]|uniref:3-hydroxyisobutyryl-CoA hydrolase n=1 Tax=Ambrosia artemisiifolia TaxID=4212 RepID=A0AAD5DBE8_AMBAR|nr:hypothetical protein M8C21_015418 [Ambrosia artemisiifolia]